jgi:hypothetical protein
MPREGVVGKPALELTVDFVGELWSIREQVSLREQDQVLMPIDLEDDLEVAGRGQVEIRDAAKVEARLNAEFIVTFQLMEGPLSTTVPRSGKRCSTI